MCFISPLGAIMLCQDFIDWRAVNRVSPFNIHTHTGRKRTAVLTSLLTALSPSSHRQAFTNHRLRPPRCCYWMEILSFYDGAVTFYFRLLGLAFPALCAAGCHIHRLKIFINQFKSQRCSSGKKNPAIMSLLYRMAMAYGAGRRVRKQFRL